MKLGAACRRSFPIGGRAAERDKGMAWGPVAAAACEGCRRLCVLPLPARAPEWGVALLRPAGAARSG